MHNSANHHDATSYVHAISFVAPGLPDWQHTQAVLRGESTYQAAELATYQPTLLPPNERRRASPTVRMAFRIAEQLTRNTTTSAAQLACVFSSSDGDMAIAHRICNALADATRLVSPTDFHNSVHNAAAGYWSIAANAKGPSTAIAVFDFSFAAGLVEAHGMVQVEQQPTLMVVYDVPAVAPLCVNRPLTMPVGIGMIITPDPLNAIASLQLQVDRATATPCNNIALEAMRTGNPAARGLPLLQAIATGSSDEVNIPFDEERCLKVTLRTAAKGSSQ